MNNRPLTISIQWNVPVHFYLSITILLAAYDLWHNLDVFPMVKIGVNLVIIALCISLFLLQQVRLISAEKLLLVLSYAISLLIYLPYWVPNSFANAMHLNSFWHLGIGLALVVICGYTNGRKHIVYLGVLNLALYAVAFLLLSKQPNNAYTYNLQSFALMACLLFVFYSLFSNQMEQHQSLMKKKNRVHAKNLQFEEEKRIFFQDKITYFEMSKAIKTEMENCLKNMKQKDHQGIATNYEHNCHKLQQLIGKIETLMKKFTCEPYLTEHKAIIKALHRDINDMEAQIAILSVMGLSIQQMASTLNKSENSITTYRQGLKTKLNLRSAHDLVPYLKEILRKNVEEST